MVYAVKYTVMGNHGCHCDYIERHLETGGCGIALGVPVRVFLK